jgi:predicted Zn-dependent protease with MMP-like domain
MHDDTYETLSEHEWEQTDRIWTMLDEGHVAQARTEIDGMLARRPRHPDLKIVDAAVALDENSPDRALAALGGADRSADPALLFHLRAVAHYERVELAAAREDALRALVVQPDQAETHSLLAKTLELLGDVELAADHEELAEKLDPDNFPPPLDLDDEAFDRLVEKSVAELPAEVRKHLDEIPVWVEALPRVEILTAADPPLSPDLLGLFVGRDLLTRGVGDVPTSPGAIYLFRRNLLRACADEEELAHEVRITVQHEVGHLLGLDEDDLEAWGLA